MRGLQPICDGGYHEVSEVHDESFVPCDYDATENTNWKSQRPYVTFGSPCCPETVVLIDGLGDTVRCFSPWALPSNTDVPPRC